MPDDRPLLDPRSTRQRATEQRLREFSRETIATSGRPGGREKVVAFPGGNAGGALSGHRTFCPPCAFAYTRTRERATKASYFTGTVAISVNTIKPSVHVRRLRQSLGAWKYVQEGRELFSSGTGRGKRKREREGRTSYVPGLVQSCRWKASLYGLSFIPTRKYRAARARRELLSRERIARDT